MRIEMARKVFVGVRVDNKLRDAIEHCPARDKVYLDGSDPRYLQVVRGDNPEGESFVGKLVDGGMSAAAMDDLKRNIQSILNRVSTGRRGDDDVKIFATDEGEPPPVVPKPPRDGYGDRSYGE